MVVIHVIRCRVMITEPLVRALAGGDAVAFVGSGASISSGLADWRTFLSGLLDYAESLHARGMDSADAGWRRTRQLLEGGDFLQAAEMLQRELPNPTFISYIEGVFGAVAEPNDIHRSIARLPFSLALTNNFDVLLEAAYRNAAHFSWKDTDAIFNAIRSKNFAIVKLHGSVRDVESIRLTRTHYRDSTFSNPELNECLKSLLTWKTLLFIGYSLRDSDLLQLFDAARLTFGKKFGPHYAIMPTHEVDGKFRSYLKDAFAIEVIDYESNPNDSEQATVKVSKILRNLSGQVARFRYETVGIPRSDSSATRAQAAHTVLANAVHVTGSMRGDVCFMVDDTNPQIRRVASYPRRNADTLPTIDYDSVIGTAFLQANSNIGKDYIYLKNVANAAAELEECGYPSTRYVVCDMDVQSELAYPIIADGRRVGTLNLEADVRDAYTDDHILVVRRLAEELGQVYIQSERRRMRSVPLASFYQEPSRFEGLLKKSRLINALGHEFILYEIDYEAKRLIAHHGSTSGPFGYGFATKSLATKAFSERYEIHVEDAQSELAIPRENRHSWLNEHGVERFKITGPVFACPVRLGGQTEAILVTWMNADSRNLPADVTTPLGELFRSSCRQVLRLANLVANDRLGTDVLRAEDLLDELYDRLHSIDRGKVWSKADLTDAGFRDRVLRALMSALASDNTGLKRIRVWKSTGAASDREPTGLPTKPAAFCCVRSLTCREFTVSGKPEWDAYAGCVTSADDVYCRYTISRYTHDPYARWQHPAMFGRPDGNCQFLDKDPTGSWIVAPIVRKNRLIGFISADNHQPRNGPKQLGDPNFREIAQQCRIINVVSDLASYVLPVEGDQLGGPKG
ncbi:MAG: SIR2 family protein [Bryobacteraceae bacterium]